MVRSVAMAGVVAMVMVVRRPITVSIATTAGIWELDSKQKYVINMTDGWMMMDECGLTTHRHNLGHSVSYVINMKNMVNILNMVNLSSLVNIMNMVNLTKIINTVNMVNLANMVNMVNLTNMVNIVHMVNLTNMVK